MAEHVVPPRVATTERLTSEAGFEESRVPEADGPFLPATAAKPDGVAAESGTGRGDTARPHSGPGAGARLVTVERVEGTARRVAEVFADDDRVSVLGGGQRLLERHAPFDVFFCDGGGRREDPQGVVELLTPGGLLVPDDCTPSPRRPPLFGCGWGESRLSHLTHPALEATWVLTTAATSAVVAARRPRDGTIACGRSFTRRRVRGRFRSTVPVHGSVAGPARRRRAGPHT